jgi:UDP-N-acetylglucosamine 2-epimerase (non-hydrolysing)
VIRQPVVIAGARPNFPKVAPLMRALTRVGMEPRLVHTGQHYDAAMSASFFESLDIPEPAANLGVGSGTHATQTAAVMVALESWLESAGADALLVVGDVNSTVACALVAAKAGIPVGHVEAGLRSFDRTMPEEINRVVVDALSTWLFTPSADGDENLLAEGVEPGRIHLVGNVMVDSLHYALPEARKRTILNDLGLVRDRFGLVTLHRPALVDNPERLSQIICTLEEVAQRLPLVFPVHPRTRQMLQRSGVALESASIRFIEPLGYLDFLALEEGASLVLTDSGGVQEETSAIGVPCLTLRDNTERPVTITQGTNTLVGFDRKLIVSQSQLALERGRRPSNIPLWDGNACERIAEILRTRANLPLFLPPALTTADSAEFRAGRGSVTTLAANR